MLNTNRSGKKMLICNTKCRFATGLLTMQMSKKISAWHVPFQQLNYEKQIYHRKPYMLYGIVIFFKSIKNVCPNRTG